VSHEPSAGRPGCALPVFMNQIEGSCPLISVCMERMSVTSSTNAREVREQFGHIHSTLAVFLKFPRTAEQFFGGAINEAERISPV